MKYLLLSVALLSASPVAAGGPMIVEDEIEVTVAKPSSNGLVPVIVGLVVLCAIFCGGDDDPAPAPVTCYKEGC